MRIARSSFLSRSLRVALLAGLAVIPLAGVHTSAHQSDEQPLDLPAMTLRPTDLTDRGLEGFGLSFSVLADDPAEVGDFIAFADMDPGSDDAAAYVAADAERYYILDLDNSVPDEEGEWTYSTQVVETFVLEYDDEDDAADGLAAMENVWDDSDKLVEADVTGAIGDGAFYLEGEGIDNWTMEPSERSILVFQLDTIVGGILVYNSDVDGTFDQDMTEALGRALLNRVDAGLDGDMPGLSSGILRPEVSADNTWYDQYLSIDGVYLCPSQIVALGECHLSQDYVDDYNEVSRYYVETRLAGDFESGVPESYFINSLWTFQDEQSAELRFEEMRDARPGENATVHDLDLGDESIGWSQVNEEYMRETLLVRSGNTIFEMRQSTEYALASEQGWTFEPSADALQNLAGIQVACLEGEVSCAEPVAIPEGMIPTEPDVATAQAGALVAIVTARLAP